MQKTILTICALLLIAACKKESNNSQQGQITFTLNGVNYSIPVNSSGDSIVSTSMQGDQDNQIIFGGHNGNNIAFIELDKIINTHTTPALDTGVYYSRNYDSACSYQSMHDGCRSFNFSFGGDSFQVASYLDSAAILTVTSYSTTTHLMSGTFQGYVSDSYSLWLPLTNGKFTDVPFFVN